jgi:hypothetical protein
MFTPSKRGGEVNMADSQERLARYALILSMVLWLPLANAASCVTLTTGMYAWDHFAMPTDVGAEFFEAGPDPVPPQGYDCNQVYPNCNTRLVTNYQTLVLENEYLKVVLLPDLGGRIISILHKPSDSELLYDNPVATPYAIGAKVFYYDYLAVVGGIAATFPEPEHGKYWNKPWDADIVENSCHAVTVTMSRIDDDPRESRVPTAFALEPTHATGAMTVTLARRQSSLKVDFSITNTSSENLEFEYWTSAALAPGKSDEEPRITGNTRILAPIELATLRAGWWPWMGIIEELVEPPVNGDANSGIYRWDKLSYLNNWLDFGIAYAHPGIDENWWGIVNSDANVGVLRVSKNHVTPGLKIWSFGPDGLNPDMSDQREWRRPMVELWAGFTGEFFEKDVLAAHEVRTWTDYYMPMVGLEEVTAASNHGACHLSAEVGAKTTVIDVDSSLNSPNIPVSIRIYLDGRLIQRNHAKIKANSPLRNQVRFNNSEILAGGSIVTANFRSKGKTLLSCELLVEPLS